MLVVDTSAFVSLEIAAVLDSVLTEYDVHTTEYVLTELETTAEYDDVHGRAARTALDQIEDVTVHDVGEAAFQTSRIDAGEATCVALADDCEANYLVTDDLRALPELQRVTDARVAISPILLCALVRREVLTAEEAREKLEAVATSRDWLGAPIYRRARRLFEE